MHDEKYVRLPDTTLGTNRNLSYGFVGHGDIGIDFWVGEHEEPHEDTEDSVFLRMHHGAHAPFLASLVGFYRRVGVPEEQTQEVFCEAASEVLQDPNMQSGYYQQPPSDLGRIASGEHTRYVSSFDQPERCWDALRDPIKAQPGLLEETGGTGLYTCVDASGEQLFVLARLEVVPGGRQVEVGKHIELTVADIPVVAEAVCQSSHGDYRREVYGFIQETFPQ